MEVAKVTIISVPMRPTFPTTQPKRKYIITPNTVRMEGVKTPPNVFNFFAEFTDSFLIIILFISKGKYTYFKTKNANAT